jgi:hypothetical protein
MNLVTLKTYRRVEIDTLLDRFEVGFYKEGSLTRNCEVMAEITVSRQLKRIKWAKRNLIDGIRPELF